MQIEGETHGELHVVVRVCIYLVFQIYPSFGAF